MVLPSGIYVEYLPPYSPELQPAERLWSVADEPLVNKSFDKIQDLEAVLSWLSNFIDNHDRTHQKSDQLLLVATKHLL